MKLKKKTIIICLSIIILFSLYSINHSIHSKRLAAEVLGSINLGGLSDTVQHIKIKKVRDALFVPDYVSYYMKFKASPDDMQYILNSGLGDEISWDEYLEQDASEYMNLFGDIVLWFNPDVDNSRVIVPNLGESSTATVVLLDTKNSNVYIKVKEPTGF